LVSQNSSLLGWLTTYVVRNTLVKCGRCRSTMFGLAEKSGKYHYYACANRYRTGDCTARSIPVAKLVLDFSKMGRFR